MGLLHCHKLVHCQCCVCLCVFLLLHLPFCFSDVKLVCLNPYGARGLWRNKLWFDHEDGNGSKEGRQPLCYQEDNPEFHQPRSDSGHHQSPQLSVFTSWKQDQVEEVEDDLQELSYSLCYHRDKDRQILSSFTCVKSDGVEPPEDLTSFMTSLLHERDVTHHLTWTGDFWPLGSGAYAEVHLGRLERPGVRECVVIKQFVDSPLSTIEREIHMHRYIEQILPNTPRLLGLLPMGPQLDNTSLVYQLVPDSYTLHDWFRFRKGLSTSQWLSVALQLAEALETLHRKCVLHNDLHSDNILLHFHQHRRGQQDCRFSRLEKREDDLNARFVQSFAKVKDASLPTVTLIDFGHATFRKGKVYKGREESLASCRHLAPEVVQHEETTLASDVYSLGHELEHIAEVLNMSSLMDIVWQCLHPDPEARPPAREVVHRLRKLFLKEYRRDIAQSERQVTEWLNIELTLVKRSRFDHSSHNSVSQSFSESTFAQKTHSKYNFQPYKNGPEVLPKMSNVKSCHPEVLENAMSELTLPYITLTGDLSFKTSRKKKLTFFDSECTVIFLGQFCSSGAEVIIKQLKVNHGDFFRIRFEAMVNAYLSEMGWVPTFYGVVPLNKYDLDSLGIVQEMFAQGITLEEVLDAGRPFGVLARVQLAYQLTSLLHDVHSSHMLINNFKSDNILCACVNDYDCSDIKLIDLDEASGCGGKRFDSKQSYLRHFHFLAPEVRQNQMTSFASDVFSLCVVLDVVLDKQALLQNRDKECEGRVCQFLNTWTSLSKLCSSEYPDFRPSTFQLKHFFSTFIKSS